MALVSLRESQVRRMEKAGKSGARIAALAGNPNRFLSNGPDRRDPVRLLLGGLWRVDYRARRRTSPAGHRLRRRSRTCLLHRHDTPGGLPVPGAGRTRAQEARHAKRRRLHQSPWPSPARPFRGHAPRRLAALRVHGHRGPALRRRPSRQAGERHLGGTVGHGGRERGAGGT
jgi:hypothetical protein